MASDRSGNRRRRESAPAAPAARAAQAKGPEPRALEWLWWAAPAVLSVWLHLPALTAYFSPDDLILLERARGIVPFPDTAWRVISGRVFWMLGTPVFGVQPLGWHVLGLALHATATVLVSVWARRLGASRAVAFLAALMFGATARARTVLWQVSGTGEILATLAMLIVMLVLLERRNPKGTLAATVMQTVGLFCKETIGLAPIALAFAPRREGAPRPAWVVPVGASVAVFAYILLTRPHTGSLGGEAYAMGFGRHVVDHLLTYALWSTDLLHLFARYSSPLPWVPAAGALALIAALVVFAWRSGSAPARVGLSVWALTLAPVLLLKTAEYEHYLYAPRAGWALALASALVALGSRFAPIERGVRREGIAAWAIVALVALAQLVTGTMYLAAMQHVLVPQIGLPRDTFMRKMEVARNAAASLTGRLPSEPTRLVVYAAPGANILVGVKSGQVSLSADPSRPHYTLISGVLDEGRGLRAIFPQLTDVRFGEHILPADSSALLALDAVAGEIVLCGRGPAGHIAVARYWADHGEVPAARLHLSEAVLRYPDSAPLALEQAASETPQRMPQALREVIARFPGTLEAQSASQMLVR